MTAGFNEPCPYLELIKRIEVTLVEACKIWIGSADESVLASQTDRDTEGSQSHGRNCAGSKSQIVFRLCTDKGCGVVGTTVITL